MPGDELTTHIAALLGVASGRSSQIDLEPAAPGGNNRVWVAAIDGRRVAVKQYYRHRDDRRDRLAAEWAFLRYCAAAGIRQVPAPVACDAERGLGVYEFIEGTAMPSQAVDAGRVREAAGFFLALNDPAHQALARDLPGASEACFTIEAHLALVGARVARLCAAVAAEENAAGARGIVARLRSCWQEIEVRLPDAARAMRVDPAAIVEARCVSPSDFGFHNARVRPNGALCFLDFEYAGWDDPAKLVGDFFLHPGVSVPHDHVDEFVRATMGFSPHGAALARRAAVLMPVLEVKWCCIMLNDLVPESARRRRFADPLGGSADRRRARLENVRLRLDRVERGLSRDGA